MVIVHYTGMDSAQTALNRLCNTEAKVSAHYLIDENGNIFALVEENKRAWHAGIAEWEGKRDINACSIGIELAHRGHDENGQCAPFPATQMQSVKALLEDIITRHNIAPSRILGHSDIAPARKIDPGETFDWKWLAKQGIGLFSHATEINAPTLSQGARGEDVAALRQNLQNFGYGIATGAEYDEECATIISAFQRHFRPETINGNADTQTQARLLDLLAQKGYKQSG